MTEPTTQTTQQSSGQPDPSNTAAQQSADAGSQGTQTAATPPARPDYVPESFWDPTANAVKAQEFSAHLTELQTLKAQHDARLAAIPKDAAYEHKLPEGYKAPEGVTLDEKHPLTAPFRAWAAKNQLPQQAYSDAVAMFSDWIGGDVKAVTEMRAAEQQKLGANAAARVDAMRTGLAGRLGEQKAAALMDRLALASDFEAMEDLVRGLSSQGGGQFQQTGRTQPDPPQPTIVDRWYPGNGQQKKAS